MQVRKHTLISALTIPAALAICVTLGAPAKACTVSPKNLASYGMDVDRLTAAVAASSHSAETLDAATRTPSGVPPRGVEGGTEYFGGAQIVGLWKATYTSGGQTADVGFEVWHSDGTEVYNDIAPPAEGNVCLGVWSQTGRSTFKLYHPAWTFDMNGNLTGTAIIRVNVTLNANASKYSGTYTFDFFDNSGNSMGHYEGQVSATRITVN